MRASEPQSSTSLIGAKTSASGSASEQRGEGDAAFPPQSTNAPSAHLPQGSVEDLPSPLSRSVLPAAASWSNDSPRRSLSAQGEPQSHLEEPLRNEPSSESTQPPSVCGGGKEGVRDEQSDEAALRRKQLLERRQQQALLTSISGDPQCPLLPDLHQQYLVQQHTLDDTVKPKSRSGGLGFFRKSSQTNASVHGSFAGGAIRPEVSGFAEFPPCFGDARFSGAASGF